MNYAVSGTINIGSANLGLVLCDFRVFNTSLTNGQVLATYTTLQEAFVATRTPMTSPVLENNIVFDATRGPQGDIVAANYGRLETTAYTGQTIAEWWSRNGAMCLRPKYALRSEYGRRPTTRGIGECVYPEMGILYAIAPATRRECRCASGSVHQSQRSANRGWWTAVRFTPSPPTNIQPHDLHCLRMLFLKRIPLLCRKEERLFLLERQTSVCLLGVKMRAQNRGRMVCLLQSRK